MIPTGANTFHSVGILPASLQPKRTLEQQLVFLGQNVGQIKVAATGSCQKTVSSDALERLANGSSGHSAGCCTLAPLLVGTGAALALRNVASLRLRRRSRRQAVQPGQRTRVMVHATAAEKMTKAMSTVLPKFAEIIRVEESEESSHLGLFTSKDFSAGETVFKWNMNSDTVMEPLPQLVDKFESEDFGALAFQLLKLTRLKDPSPWKLWWSTGVKAPETHPLKLALSDPGFVQLLWGSTTCGGRMCASAVKLRDDVDVLNGGATMEEWAEFMALAMSRSIVQDESGMPLLVLGLDLLQDGDDPNVKAQVVYENEGWFGGGAPTQDRIIAGVELVALRNISEDEELTCKYVEAPHAGRYLERYGFVPPRLRGNLAPGCIELAFAPTDEEEDYNYYTKEQLLEDLGLTTDPVIFTFLSEDTFGPPENNQGDWDKKNALDKMCHILRMRLIDGNDAFLLDSVYINNLWTNCCYRISKDNELALCKTIIEECDRWLKRFEGAEEDQEDLPAKHGDIVMYAEDLRRAESEILMRIRDVFAQEMRDTIVDDKRLYWVERQMEDLFPQMKYGANVNGSGIEFQDMLK